MWKLQGNTDALSCWLGYPGYPLYDFLLAPLHLVVSSSPASRGRKASHRFHHGQLGLCWFYFMSWCTWSNFACIKIIKRLSSFTDNQSLFKLSKPLHRSSMDGVGWQWFELDGSLADQCHSAVHIWRCHPHPAMGFLALMKPAPVISCVPSVLQVGHLLVRHFSRI